MTSVFALGGQTSRPARPAAPAVEGLQLGTVARLDPDTGSPYVLVPRPGATLELGPCLQAQVPGEWAPGDACVVGFLPGGRPVLLARLVPPPTP